MKGGAATSDTPPLQPSIVKGASGDSVTHRKRAEGRPYGLETGAPLALKKETDMSSLNPQRSGASTERHATTPPSTAAAPVLRLSERQKRIVDTSLAIETESAAEASSIGFAARVWTQLALPYRDPGEVSRWERRNGNTTLVVRPATLIARDGTTYDGYPFGVIPRYLLTWMATEAVRTQNPRLDIGDSFNSFMARVGLSGGGTDARRLKDQIARLVGATMQVQDVRRENDGHTVTGQNFNVAESFELWIPDHDSTPEAQGALWTNTVTLSPQFYRSIIEAPIPVDLRALRALAGSPMRLDIYTWLTYRMSYLTTTTLIPWESLAIQFGGQYARTRAFKSRFLDALNAVSVIYPAARFKPEERGLRLYPSAPHVARKKAAGLTGGKR